jgi:hypothetical protein
MRRDRTQLVLISVPVVLAVAAISTTVVLYFTLPRRPMASKSDCDRVLIGMTRAEVEHVLGGPPGDYRTRPSKPPLSWFAFGDEWQGDGGMVFVQFDEDGRETDKLHIDHRLPGQPSLIDRIMRR